MPKKLDDAVRSIMRNKGYSKRKAFAIATSTLQKAGKIRRKNGGNRRR